MATKRKIRVLECIRQGQIGGGESHLLSLVENLNLELFEPIVLSFTEGPMVERLRQMDIDTTVIYTERPFDFSKWSEVKKFIKQKNIDIVHAHGTRANSNVLRAAKSLSIPVIYTIHGWSFHQDQSAIVRRIRAWGERYLTSHSNLNIAVSASNQLTGKRQIPGFQSVVINNGINQSKFNPAGKFKNVRKELNISESELLILFIARFTSHKQPLSLLHGFAKAIENGLQGHLLMVGDGDEKEAAKSLVIEKGLESKVTLSTFRQDVPDVLAAADIFVLPSLWEGLPIGLLEAMAMGKAIIASNVDGTSEIITNGENGLLIDTSDLSTNISKALIKLANDKILQKKLGENAKSSVTQKFNAITMTRQIEEQYLKLAHHL